ncbi:MAG: sulfate reduction electron transfer complex DsrMKJOP subunit DsrM, partial [Planctomycetota bacterium]
MNPLVSLALVAVLFLVGMFVAGVGPIGIVFAYVAVALFLGGLIYRVLGWANVPVPFRIPTTCGQQKSLPWIKQSKVDNPDTAAGVVVRMILEVLFFRSLLRNSTVVLREKGKLAFIPALGLWLGAMAFHWSMLIILLRHIRFFTEPVPFPVFIIEEA